MIRALALTGPTASGKTELSLRLSEALGAEILSCDSMQIYRGMDVGTAKATPEEQAKVPHHLIDLCDPGEDFSAENYRDAALAAARDVTARGKLPLFVGGTGLYLDTLMRAPAPDVPPASRKYRERAEALGKDALYERLLTVDPASAEAIHKNNIRRVIRALEIYDATGKTKSELDAASRIPNPDFSIGLLVLAFHDRERLYASIDARVDRMFDKGLVEEVRRLLGAGVLAPESTAYQAIGYKEIAEAIANHRPMKEAREAIKLSTHHYAKRQETWFRHEADAEVVYLDRENGKLRKEDEVFSELCEKARAKLISISQNEGNEGISI